MLQPSRQSESTPGHMLVTIALVLFIIVAVVRRLNAPVLWDRDTASIIAPAEVLNHWPEGRLDINRASEAELCLLPGIGPARARAIIEERDRNGTFAAADDLDRVHGIGLKTIDWFDDCIVFHHGQ